MQQCKTIYTTFLMVFFSLFCFLLSGCGRKVTDSQVRNLSLGDSVDVVLNELGKPKARGREVTLKSEGAMVKEYPRNLEAFLWEGEKTYLLTFHKGELAKKEAFLPAYTKVSVKKLGESNIREGDEIKVSITAGQLYGGSEL